MANEKKSLEQLRKENWRFDSFVAEVTSHIETIIEHHNTSRSFHPTGSRQHKISIVVDAIPMNISEKCALVEYLDETYLPQVLGFHFTITKLPFSARYRIKTIYVSEFA